MAGDQTTLARAQLSRDSEARVLAEGALDGEKLVARARLAMLALSTLAIGVSAFLGVPGAHAPVRGAVALAYALWAVMANVKLPRTSSQQLLTRWGFALTTVDVAYFGLMGWLSLLIEPDPRPEIVTASLALPLLFTIARNSLAQVVYALVLVAAAWVAIALRMHAGHPDVRMVLLVLASYTTLALITATTGLRTRKLFSNLRKRDNLTRFLSPQVVEQVMRYGEGALAPTQREATLLFSDIRDFTALSETMEPRALLALLDDYFGEMTRIVMGCEGSVNKLIGDGMLAVWGVPERTGGHAFLAVKAALAMRARMVELNAFRAGQGQAPLRIGIGVHTGRVAAGMLGGAEQHEYTVIGDAVNLCSRIEGLNKEHGTDILISEATWTLVAERFAGALCCESLVKGRAQPVRVYTLEGIRPGAASALNPTEAGLPLSQGA
jgi:adenylate cyclase